MQLLTNLQKGSVLLPIYKIIFIIKFILNYKGNEYFNVIEVEAILQLHENFRYFCSV